MKYLKSCNNGGGFSRQGLFSYGSASSRGRKDHLEDLYETRAERVGGQIVEAFLEFLMAIEAPMLPSVCTTEPLQYTDWASQVYVRHQSRHRRCLQSHWLGISCEISEDRRWVDDHYCCLDVTFFSGRGGEWTEYLRILVHLDFGISSHTLLLIRISTRRWSSLRATGFGTSSRMRRWLHGSCWVKASVRGNGDNITCVVRFFILDVW